MDRPATAAVRLLTGEREPVRLATTANLPTILVSGVWMISGGLQTIDGVLTAVGDRILVKDQTRASLNGIYTVSAGYWYRAADARTARTMQKGTTVHVQEGTANAGKTFAFQSLNPVIGTDDITITFYTSDDLVGDAVDALNAAAGSFVSDAVAARAGAEAARDLAQGYASDAVSQGNVPVYSTVQGLSALTIPVGIIAIRLNGYALSGDGGAWPLAIEVTNSGTLTAWQRQSNGGTRRWQLLVSTVNLEMFGGKADGTLVGTTASGTDNATALDAALGYIAANVASVYGASAHIKCGYGTYYFSRWIKIKRNISLEGASGSAGGNAQLGTLFLFPTGCRGLVGFTSTSIDPDTGLAVGTDASGATITRIMFQSTGSGTDRTIHAILMRCRMILQDCRVINFSGDGVSIVSNDAIGGNVNNWEIRGGRITGCQNGIYAAGSDANAGVATHVDTSGNRVCGILDRSFLGNTYVGCHENGNGIQCQVSYGGNRYRAYPSVARFDDPGLLSTTVPGTDSTVWEFVSVGGVNANVYPLWVSGNEYYPGGQKVSTNSNARTLFVGGYSEPGWPSSMVVYPAALWGGTNTAGIHAVSDGATFNAGTIANLRSAVSQAFTAQLGASGYEVNFDSHNTGTVSSSRGSGFASYVGYLVDGVTRKAAARFSGAGTGGASAATKAVIWTADTVGAWVASLFVNGSTLEVVAGADNTWSLGSFAARWLKGWFGNISVFPAASVTPANNGEVTFQLTSNTSLTFKVKGSDGTVRSGSITLA